MRAWYRVEVTIVTWRLFSSSIHEPSRELNEPYLDGTWLVVQFPTCKLWIFAQDRVPTLPNGCVYLPTEQGNAGQQRGEGYGMKNRIPSDCKTLYPNILQQHLHELPEMSTDITKSPKISWVHR